MDKQLIADIVERTSLTALQAFLSVWVVSSWSNLTDVTLAQQAAVAGIAAGLAVMKGLIASRLGNRSSAALLPAADPGQ
jgi:hypothetical protein